MKLLKLPLPLRTRAMNRQEEASRSSVHSTEGGGTKEPGADGTDDIIEVAPSFAGASSGGECSAITPSSSPPPSLIILETSVECGAIVPAALVT